MPEQAIAERVHACVTRLLAYNCKAIVAACNTATAVFIDRLRTESDVPFVGAEPAVLPAVRAYPRGKTVVLCTPATARQDRLQRLLHTCGNADVAVCPQPTLAQEVERHMHALSELRPTVRRIVEKTKPDALVLGCTHYVFLRPYFVELLGEERVFDGNDGIARRLVWALASRNAMTPHTCAGGVLYESIS